MAKVLTTLFNATGIWPRNVNIREAAAKLSASGRHVWSWLDEERGRQKYHIPGQRHHQKPTRLRSPLNSQIQRPQLPLSLRNSASRSSRYTASSRTPSRGDSARKMHQLRAIRHPALDPGAPFRFRFTFNASTPGSCVTPSSLAYVPAQQSDRLPLPVQYTSDAHAGVSLDRVLTSNPSDTSVL
jgi:hypothetical protein